MKNGFFCSVQTFLFLILIVWSSCLVFFQFDLAKALPTTIVVPDDYPLIQDAIDVAEDGDTVFVKKGVYYETLVINKSLTLIGENREHTIIDAHKLTENVVHVMGGAITFANFTLGNTGYIFSSGQTPPSGFFIEKGGVHIINNTIYGVSGSAFRTGSYGGATLQNNIVSQSGFYPTSSVFDRQIPLEEQAVEIKDMPSPFSADIELLEGNQILHLTKTNGASLGDLILKDNATLIVDNFSAKAQTLRAYNNSRIILLNNAYLFEHKKNGNTPMRLYLMDNVSFSLTDSSTVNLVCSDNSQILGKNSSLRGIYAHDNVVVELTNCTSYGLKADGLVEVSVYNSTFPMDEISGEAQVFVTESYVRHYSDSITLNEKGKLWIINSTFDDDLTLNSESNAWFIDCVFSNPYVGMLVSESSSLWFINCTWQQVTPLALNNQGTLWFVNCKNTTDVFEDIIFESSQVNVNSGYYLQVTVESNDGVPLENIKVEVTLPDGSLIDSGSTNTNGNMQFILATQTWNNQTTESFVSYVVKASKDWSQVQTIVDLDSNKKITLSISALNLWIFSDVNSILIIIAVVAVALTLAYLVKKRK